MYKLRSWVDINKIDWIELSENPNAIILLEKNKDKINWRIQLISKNINKINWDSLSSNPNAIHPNLGFLDIFLHPNLGFMKIFLLKN